MFFLYILYNNNKKIYNIKNNTIKNKRKQKYNVIKILKTNGSENNS